MNVIYEGIFLDQNELSGISGMFGKKLANEVSQPHITLRSCPVYTLESLYGEECDVIITGYGNDGKNEGLKVIAVSANSMLNSLIDRIEHPHIAVSFAPGADPANTAELVRKNKMKKCKKIVKTKGIFGAFTPNGIITGKEEHDGPNGTA